MLFLFSKDPFFFLFLKCKYFLFSISNFIPERGNRANSNHREAETSGGSWDLAIVALTRKVEQRARS
jgi:hypothetical protein